MKNKSLSLKLNISISILLILIFISLICSFLMIMTTNKFAEETGKSWLPSVDTAHRIVDKLVLLRLQQYGLILINDRDEFQDQLANINDNLKGISALITIYETEITEAQERAELQKFLPIWEDIRKVKNEVFQLAEKNNDKEALDLMKKKAAPLMKNAESIFFEIVDINYKGAIKSTKKGAFFTMVTVVGVIVIFSISILVSFIIFRIVKKSTNSIVNGIEDLKKQSVSTNEIAGHLKSDSTSLSNTVIEQANAVLKTSAAINQITSMVNKTTENSNESRKIAKDAALKAQMGQQTMERLVSAMQNIQDSNSELQNIAVIIKQINSKTAVINDIVSKTELLSLNASIESARAGEHGKGFAVVAEEVGNLAKVSGKSANEIQVLITASQAQVNKILEATKMRIDEGKTVTNEAQTSFQQIAEDISTMNSTIEQIAEAAREQEIGIRQIAEAMSNIDKTTQNCKTAVNTTSASSNSLVDESTKLDATAKVIEILIKGEG